MWNFLHNWHILYPFTRYSVLRSRIVHLAQSHLCDQHIPSNLNPTIPFPKIVLIYSSSFIILLRGSSHEFMTEVTRMLRCVCR
jgi:hypothetical protein